MKLYLLTRKGYTDYDQFDAFVIRASNETAARKRAQFQAHNESGQPWLSPSEVTCAVLGTSGKAGVVLGSYNAG